LSSNFCNVRAHCRRPPRPPWGAAWPVVGALLIVIGQRAPAAQSARFADVVTVTGADLAPFAGLAVERLAVMSCRARLCRPIPFQVDERDAHGRWVLDQGPEPNRDDPPNVLDDNDVLLFMATDAGERAARADLPAGTAVAEIVLHDPLLGGDRWAYVASFQGSAPRTDVSYVGYDSTTDRVHGARVSLGFRGGVPRYLAVLGSSAKDVAPPNLLDRLKVRASATFLWGLIRFARNEDDLITQFVAWRSGPIRVMRAQRQTVRIGWGIRSPTFGAYTTFYRDFAELPVSLYLNFPPHYFFGNIAVRIVLDFRDLRGWSVLAPGMEAPLLIGDRITPQQAALNQAAGSWIALLGPEATLLQTIELSPSLATVRRRLAYRTEADPPEDVPGERPGIGYVLDQWDHVGAGAHRLAAISYALPRDVDVREFLRARAVPLQVHVEPLR
jgi:hypothetical protein